MIWFVTRRIIRWMLQPVRLCDGGQLAALARERKARYLKV